MVLPNNDKLLSYRLKHTVIYFGYFLGHLLRYSQLIMMTVVCEIRKNFERNLPLIQRGLTVAFLRLSRVTGRTQGGAFPNVISTLAHTLVSSSLSSYQPQDVGLQRKPVALIGSGLHPPWTGGCNLVICPSCWWKSCRNENICRTRITDVAKQISSSKWE